MAHISPLIYLPLMLTNPDNDIVIHDLFPTKLCPHFKIVCVPHFLCRILCLIPLISNLFILYSSQPATQSFLQDFKVSPCKVLNNFCLYKRIPDLLALKMPKALSRTKTGPDSSFIPGPLCEGCDSQWGTVK